MQTRQGAQWKAMLVLWNAFTRDSECVFAVFLSSQLLILASVSQRTALGDTCLVAPDTCLVVAPALVSIAAHALAPRPVRPPTHSRKHPHPLSLSPSLPSSPLSLSQPSMVAETSPR
eukprot:COSAG03_NODE_3418_length_2030_cov_1.675816_3_plen_117_part_00